MRKIVRKILEFSLVLCLMACSLLTVSCNKTEPVNANVYSKNEEIQELLYVKRELRFNEDGSFKICVFSDIQDKLPVHEDTLKYMNKILDQEKPDLVVLTGDTIWGGGWLSDDLHEYINIIAEPMEKRQIPWCTITGNHERGSYKLDNGIDGEEMELYYESLPYNINKGSLNFDTYGTTNYVLPVFASSNGREIKLNIFCLDSHDYMNKWKNIERMAFLTGGDSKGLNLYEGKNEYIYDVIHASQIKWYYETSKQIEAFNGSLVPAVMFFHIPLVEFDYVWNNQDQCGTVGVRDDTVISSPQIDSGLFWACLERGDVMAMFCGHDHTNDFCGTFAGITLGYCATIGENEYYGANRGARIIEFSESDVRNFTTHMVTVSSLK